jgi:hypothetical protein
MGRPTSALHVALVVPAGDVSPFPEIRTALTELGRALLAGGARVDVVPLGAERPALDGARTVTAATGPPVGPGVLAAGYRLVDQLARSGATTVVAPAAGAPLWAVAALRRQGQSFSGCALVPVGPATWRACLRLEGRRIGTFDEAVIDRLEAAVEPHWAVPAPLEGEGGPWQAVHEAVPVPVAAAGAAVSSITAAVTHYERPAMLRRAVDSLIEQTRRPDEIVVVDDGSTGAGAVAALDELASAALPVPVRVVRQANAGLGAARNAALAAATGEAVAFLDDDDEAEPQYLDRMAGALAATGAAAVAVGFKVFPGAVGPMAGLAEASRWLFCSEAVALAAVDNVAGGAAAMFRRDIALAVGGFHTRRHLAYEDWEILVRLALAGHRIESVPEPLLRYRVSEGSMLRTAPLLDSHDLVLSTFAAALPGPLGVWPEVLCGFGQARRHDGSAAAGSADGDAAELQQRLAACEAELVRLRDAEARLAALRNTAWWQVGRTAAVMGRRLAGPLRGATGSSGRTE